MKFGLLLIGGAVTVTGLVGLALLSVAANGASSNASLLATGCVPTLPPDEEEDKDSDSSQQSSNT